MSISVSEVVVVLVVALLVIKPEQLPDVAFSLGKLARSVRRTFTKLKDEMNGVIESIDTVKQVDEQKREQ